MAKYLNVSARLLTIKGRLDFTDESGNAIYSAQQEFAWVSPSWRILKHGLEVASIRRVILAWPATWQAKSEFGTFRIERDLYSYTGGYWVNGGPFDKAEARGRFLSGNLSISHRGQIIASARAAPLSLRDRYSIEVVDDNEQAELLTAIIMVTHHMEDNPGFLIDLLHG